MDRSKQIVRISILGILVNVVLVAFKSVIGLATGSIAIIMDAVNNLSDALSSVITIIGTALAGRAPDKKHPYGYGRIEHVSAVTIALIVMVAGLTAFKESAAKIVAPVPAVYTAGSLVIIAVAVLVKFLLGRYVKKQGQAWHSGALITSGTESIFDSAISFSTLIAAGISLLWNISIEGWLGAIIGALIIKAGAEALLESLNSIIGERVDSGLSLQIKRDISAYPPVLGAYDLVLHRYGPEHIIGSVHVEVPDGTTAPQIHHLSRTIMQDIKAKYGIILTVGVYASNTNDPFSARMREQLLQVIKPYPDILQMHGFYVDKQAMLVAFDLVIAFRTRSRAETRDEVIAKMKELYPAYEFAVVIDNDFSD